MSRLARPRWRADLVPAAFVAACTVLLGAPAGLLWSALAPHAHIAISASGATFADGATEVFVAGDGWFLAVCAVAGLLSGFLAWLGARRSGPYAVVALAVGGLLAAYVGAKVGRRIGQDELRAAAAAGRPGTYVANVVLQAKQAVLAWPVAALATFVALVAGRRDETD
jgi:hypothetical protein